MIKRLRYRFFLQPLILVCGLSAVPGHAEIHKWVDANGNTHYSDTPPATGATDVITPKIDNTGVSISDSATSSAWKTEALKRNANASSSPRPLPSQATTSSRYPLPRSNQKDLCQGKVGACFTEQQDRVCKLRYGLDCQSLYHWKVCLEQRCTDERWADRCDSAFYYLDNRPIALNARDIGRELPLQTLLSEKDWQCLSQSGFYCDELTDEARCQHDYNQSCDSLYQWVNTAKSHCAERRDRDCDAIDTWVRYRPVSIIEAKKGGTINAAGIGIRRDLWLESLGLSGQSDANNPQLRPLLDAITGLNLGLSEFPHDCRFNPSE